MASFAPLLRSPSSPSISFLMPIVHDLRDQLAPHFPQFHWHFGCIAPNPEGGIKSEILSVIQAMYRCDVKLETKQIHSILQSIVNTCRICRAGIEGLSVQGQMDILLTSVAVFLFKDSYFGTASENNNLVSIASMIGVEATEESVESWAKRVESSEIVRWEEARSLDVLALFSGLFFAARYGREVQGPTDSQWDQFALFNRRLLLSYSARVRQNRNTWSQLFNSFRKTAAYPLIVLEEEYLFELIDKSNNSENVIGRIKQNFSETAIWKEGLIHCFPENVIRKGDIALLPYLKDDRSIVDQVKGLIPVNFEESEAIILKLHENAWLSFDGLMEVICLLDDGGSIQKESSKIGALFLKSLLKRSESSFPTFYYYRRMVKLMNEIPETTLKEHASEVFLLLKIPFQVVPLKFYCSVRKEYFDDILESSRRLSNICGLKFDEIRMNYYMSWKLACRSIMDYIIKQMQIVSTGRIGRVKKLPIERPLRDILTRSLFFKKTGDEIGAIAGVVDPFFTNWFEEELNQ